MTSISSAETTHLNSIRYAENCDKSVRLNTMEDIKENFNLMSKYNQDKYNKGTYTYVIPINQRLYDEISGILPDNSQSSNTNYNWLQNNNVAISPGVSHGKQEKYPTLTINYDSDEDSAPFKTTCEIKKNLNEYLIDNDDKEESNYIDDNTPLLGSKNYIRRRKTKQDT